MRCTVCLDSGDRAQRARSFVSTSERTPMSRIQIVFKLFELTRKEFTAGSVCPACFDLIVQIDSLEFQTKQITKTLKSRINCCSPNGKYYHHQEREDEYDSNGEEYADDYNEDEDDYYDPDGAPDPPVRKRRQRNSVAARREAKKRKSPAAMRVPQVFVDNSTESQNENEFEGEDAEEPQHDRLDVSQYMESSIKMEQDDEDHDDDDGTREGAPRVLKMQEVNRSPENLDYNVIVTKTTRGHEQLLYEGYTFHKMIKKDRQTVAPDICRWRCSHNSKKPTRCLAKVTTAMDGQCVLIDSKNPHNHQPVTDTRVRIILFREKIKQIASDHPDMKPSEILSSARMLLKEGCSGDDDLDGGSTASLGMKEESIIRFVQRVWSRNRKCNAKQKLSSHGHSGAIGHVDEHASDDMAGDDDDDEQDINELERKHSLSLIGHSV